MRNSKLEGKVGGGLAASHKHPRPLPGALSPVQNHPKSEMATHIPTVRGNMK